METLQQAIAQFRSSANLEQLQGLEEMLRAEMGSTNAQIQEIEAQVEEEAQTQHQTEWEVSEEGKEEKAEWDNKIALWYNTPTHFCKVFGDRRNPSKLDIIIENRENWKDSKERKASSLQEAIAQVEEFVGTGTPHSSNPSAGAKTWVYRWYDYGNSEWLN
jgi:hypothetical protein